MHPLLRLPYAVLGATASAAVHLPAPGSGKWARGLRARRDLATRLSHWASDHRDAARPLLWIHAPSVGEGLQARPVIEILRTRHPTWQFVYSWFSPSAERFAASLPVDLTLCLPFDTGRAARILLDALSPRALVYSKLDVWPVFAEAAHARGVRLGMIAATLSPTSGRAGWFARAVLRDAYAGLDSVGTIDVADGQRLADLGVRPGIVRITGDTRYDQVRARAAAVDRTGSSLGRLASTRPTLVAGSTWPADEARLLPAWEAVRRSHPNARLVLAPHEPTAAHLTPIERWARREGLTLARLERANDTSDVVLVDRVGVLGELYALSDVAFVGGGFHSAGLHSVLEPAAFSAPVLFGPRHEGSRDAGLLIAQGGGASVEGTDTIARAITTWFADPAARATAGRAARSVVEAGVGAAERSATLVEELMKD